MRPLLFSFCAHLSCRVKKTTWRTEFYKKGESAVRTDEPLIGRPVLCALGRGAMMRIGRNLALLYQVLFRWAILKR